MRSSPRIEKSVAWFLFFNSKLSKFIWPRKAILDNFREYTWGQWGYDGESIGLGARRPTCQSGLCHQPPLHCLRETASSSWPLVPIHKTRGVGLVGLLRLHWGPRSVIPAVCCISWKTGWLTFGLGSTIWNHGECSIDEIWWSSTVRVKKMGETQQCCSNLSGCLWLWSLGPGSLCAPWPLVPSPSSSVQPLEWVVNSQWLSVQWLGGGGGGGESALNPVLVRMLWVAETKPWLELA